MLTGDAVLFFGNAEYSVGVGDHICFQAGVESALHLENRSASPCTYLVYRAREHDDDSSDPYSLWQTERINWTPVALFLLNSAVIVTSNSSSDQNLFA